jgi:plastocyanin
MGVRQLLAGILGCAVTAGSVIGMSAASTVDVLVRVVASGKSVPNAVVWVEAPGAPRAPQTVVLDQRNLAFEPGVLVTSVGSTVEFPNNDRVLHNVFSFKDGKRFDLGLYPVGQRRRVVFDRAGVSRIFCNIHPGMAAYIVVVDSPYYGLTDRDGRAVLRGVPVGSRSVRAWRPGGGDLAHVVTAVDDMPLEIQWPAR